MEQRKLVHVRREPVGERHDDGENHGRGADHRRADQHRLRRGLESIARAVIGFEQMLGPVEADGHVEVFLDLGLYVWNLLDQRELIYGLRVVCHRPVGIDGDGYRSHAEEAEGHKPESKDGWRQHASRHRQSHRAHVVGDGHQAHHREAEIVSGEVACDEARQDAQRGSALLRRDYDFLHVPRFGGREDLDQFGDDRTRQRSTRDDRCQLPPLRGIATKVGNDVMRNQVGQSDRNKRGNPDQRSQRRLKVHLARVSVLTLGDRAVEKVGDRAGHQHHHAHHEDPHQQLHLHCGIFHAQQDERNQRHACDAVGFEAVC